jgi:hypothetical protein
MRRFVVFLCCCALPPAISCTGGESTSSTPTIPSPVAATSTTSATATTEPTPPATPATRPPTSGASTATCQGGWVTPQKGSSLWTFPLQVIQRASGFSGFTVVDMRTFVGQESPPTDKNYLMEIRRWYVKLYDPTDLSFQGRFLVEDRRFGRGLAAVAPYDSRGFTSPDWVGFQYDAGDRQSYTYAGLPGRWSGIAYDFVDGGQGLTFPGLPSELSGCLGGT